MFELVWYELESSLNIVMHISILSHFKYGLREALSKSESEIMKSLLVHIESIFVTWFVIKVWTICDSRLDNKNRHELLVCVSTQFSWKTIYQIEICPSGGLFLKK